MNKQEIEQIRAEIKELNQDIRMIYDHLSAETDKLRDEMEAAFSLVSKRLKELRQQGHE